MDVILIRRTADAIGKFYSVTEEDMELLVPNAIKAISS